MHKKASVNEVRKQSKEPKMSRTSSDPRGTHDGHAIRRPECIGRADRRQTREPSAACRPFLRFGNISESILWLIARKEKMMRSRMSSWTLILDTSGVTAIEYGL